MTEFALEAGALVLADQGREGEGRGGREGRREGERERRRERWREGGTEGGRERGKERRRQGGRERGRELGDGGSLASQNLLKKVWFAKLRVGVRYVRVMGIG